MCNQYHIGMLFGHLCPSKSYTVTSATWSAGGGERGRGGRRRAGRGSRPSTSAVNNLGRASRARGQVLPIHPTAQFQPGALDLGPSGGCRKG